MIEVDPNTLGEASKALLWVIGLLVTGGGGYLVGRKQKVQLEPNAVEVAPSLCARQLKDNADDHSNIFLRLALRPPTQRQRRRPFQHLPAPQ